MLFRFVIACNSAIHPRPNCSCCPVQEGSGAAVVFLAVFTRMARLLVDNQFLSIPVAYAKASACMWAGSGARPVGTAVIGSPVNPARSGKQFPYTDGNRFPECDMTTSFLLASGLRFRTPAGPKCGPIWGARFRTPNQVQIPSPN